MSDIEKLTALYRDAYGTRERAFGAHGNTVMASDDGGGFEAASCNSASEAVLVAELLRWVANASRAVEAAI